MQALLMVGICMSPLGLHLLNNNHIIFVRYFLVLNCTIFSFLGHYSSVTFRLKLYRKLNFHLLRTYLPSFLFVIISWFSMFVPLNHVPGKLTGSFVLNS